MRKTIIATDNTVYRDGEWLQSDCSELVRAGISAVQWDGEQGEIEYAKHAHPNEPIDDFTPFEKYFATAKRPPEPEVLTIEEAIARGMLKPPPGAKP